jgi:hypothetical protein
MARTPRGTPGTPIATNRLGVLAGAAVGAVTAGASLADLGNLYFNTSYSSGFSNTIIFPSDLPTRNVPFMSMEFERYQRRSINEQPSYTSQMRIILPIPENLVETTSVSYSKEALGSAVGAITNSLSGVTNIGSSGGLSDIVQNIGSRLGGAAAGVGTEAISNLVRGSLANTGFEGYADRAINAASALSGITTNPFEVILFKTPNFRTHTFGWDFIPNTLQESETLKQLIETFKYHSLPGISAAGSVFFSYPEILKINFRPRDEYLYKFKPSVVESVRVNYAPNKPSFVKSSGAPAAIQFQINIQEIEIMTKADFLRNQSGFFSLFRTNVPVDIENNTP